MTGFARIEGRVDECNWVWEAKSVNAKGMDFRCRLNGFDILEKTLRDHVNERFSRGSISVMLTVDWMRPEKTYKVNEEVLTRLSEIVLELHTQFPDSQPVSLDGLLSISSLIESSEEAIDPKRREVIEQKLIEDFIKVLDGLAKMRSDEGKHLKKFLQKQLQDMSKLCVKATKLAASQPAAIRKRLNDKLCEFMEELPALSEERVAQEITVLLVKADIREELDRLASHYELATALVTEPGPVGRRLDFLFQEFNREVNTICSKARDVELTRLGLAMKASIEQMREQVQNVE
tara:strand:+ start:1240 stop:2112 length:873 start_codon:yes stop_codon:yes gene_type:complete